MNDINRGNNSQEYWNQKHVIQYSSEEYNFSQLENDPLSYHYVASKIIEDNKESIERKSMLEIGCAVGYFSSYVKQRVVPDFEVVDWDFSPSGIKLAKERNKDIQGLIFEERDVILNPVDKDYGIICSFETIEHFEEGLNYTLLNNWLDHCEYLILSTVDTKDSCNGEHLSHYTIDTFDQKGYNVLWKAKLAPIFMPDGTYHYIAFLIKGKLNEIKEY